MTCSFSARVAGLAFLLLALAPSALAQLPPPPAPPENPITTEKAVLGKILFFDEQLSSDNTMACATCHIPSAGGADPRSAGAGNRHPGLDGVFNTPDDVFGSPGVLLQDALENYQPSTLFGFEPQVTGRSAPSSVGAQYFPELFWDGRASSAFTDPETGLVSIPLGGALESQAVGPPVSDAEMAHQARDWSQITAKLATATPLKLASSLTPDIVTALGLRPDYPGLFAAAFGSPAITAERIAYAIATYERTLVPNQTPWDAFNQGNPAALTPQQAQGLNIFNGPANCAICHTPPLFSNGTFRNIGVRPLGEDLGRFEITGNPGDRGRFKVPSLRNVGLRQRYLHNGQESTLAQVALFYARGGDFPQNQDPLINPFPLPPGALAQLTDFLANGLTDPRVANELFPFDRPLLSSESAPANPRVFGSGVSGSGGFTPRMIANSPPNLGNSSFKLGVAGGLGGARAYLVLFTSQWAAAASNSARITNGRASFRGSLRLEGAGAGGGFGTLHLPIPQAERHAGKHYFARWFIEDPAASGGFARSEVVEVEIF